MSKEDKSKTKEAESNDADINRRSYLKMVGASAGLSAGGTGLTSLGIQSARAQQESPCNTVDDFEDADLSEYEFDRGSSGATIVSSPTYSGSHALEISGTNTEMISMNGLGEYPAAGDVFSTWVRGTNNADRINITYGVQNHLNRYFARLNPEQGHMALYRTEDGSSTLLTDKSVPLSQDTWYEVHIDWQSDGTHVFTLFDDNGSQVSQISATDSTWTAGGIGYDAYLGDGGTVYIDHTQIHSGREIVSANEVIDSFEDSDLSEYHFDQGSSGANIVSDTTYAGSSVLEISGTNTEMISTSSFDHYPSAGDVFSSWVRGTGGADDINFTYGVQDHTNRYFVRVDFANDNLKLYRYENASATLLEKQTSGFTLTEDTWYNVEVDWRKTGVHTTTLYNCNGKEVAQITGSDSTWTDGGIGYDAYLESSGGTVYFDYVAIHSSVLDDFEDGDLSEYSADTGSFTVQNSTVLEGNQTLKGTNAGSEISHTNVKTPRGYQYRISVIAASGSGAKPALVTSIQDPANPLDDCYYILADVPHNTLLLYRCEGGSSVQLATENVKLEEGKEYELRLSLGRGTIIGEIRDASGSALKAMGAWDDTFSDGYLGVYLNGGSPGYFDHVSKHPKAENIIDDFEDGDLKEYTGDTSYYSVQSSAVLQGSYTLKCEDNYQGIAHPDIKTPRENEYRTFIMAGSGSGARPGLLACVQDADSPMDNCYWVQASTDNNNLSLFRREAGNTTVLDRVDVTINEETEYQLAIDLGESEVKASLSTDHGRQLAETKAFSDTTYTTGNLGFYTGGSGAPAFYDYVSKKSPIFKSVSSVSETQEAANEALNSTFAQEVLSELNNPSTDPTNATRRTVYRNQSSLESHFIDIPIEYGELQVGYKNGSVTAVQADLDRSTMSNSLISDLSDDFGWPSSAEGFVTRIQDYSEPKFTRTVTDAEENDLNSIVSDYDNRSDLPFGITVMNNDGGFHRVGHYDKYYHVDSARETVLKDEKVIGSPDECTIDKTVCGIGAATVAGGTLTTAATCVGTVLSPIPGDEVLCGVGIASTTGGTVTAYESCGDVSETCDQ